MALGEDARQLGRYWTLQLSDEERTATLIALDDFYNSPDLHSQDARSAAYEVAYALGRILQFTNSGRSAVEIEAKDG
jgi:hypothetical protein